ncbi:hypothetical protein GQR58_011952 [Nymphon striatum]|nr:hypothetical protein GQR58_011952 [Nymphon striatum]
MVILTKSTCESKESVFAEPITKRSAAIYKHLQIQNKDKRYQSDSHFSKFTSSLSMEAAAEEYFPFQHDRRGDPLRRLEYQNGGYYCLSETKLNPKLPKFMIFGSSKDAGRTLQYLHSENFLTILRLTANFYLGWTRPNKIILEKGVRQGDSMSPKPFTSYDDTPQVRLTTENEQIANAPGDSPTQNLNITSILLIFRMEMDLGCISKEDI